MYWYQTAELLELSEEEASIDGKSEIFTHWPTDYYYKMLSQLKMHF